MTATDNTQLAIGADGIRRYRTNIKVLVHSHNHNETLNISDDVSVCSTGKVVKGTGQANITLVANRNYLNLLFPNDYIHVYFNRSDGNGWVRTFYGFIDRIEEEYSVADNGTPRTLYHVLCSDLTKAVEMTQIYFNPHLAGREDIDGGFVTTPNIAGLGLLTRGIRCHGSPSDIIQNLLLLTLDFGTQFTLPDSYRPAVRDRIRQLRSELIMGRLGADARRAITEAGGLEVLNRRITQQTQDVVLRDAQGADQIDILGEIPLALDRGHAEYLLQTQGESGLIREAVASVLTQDYLQGETAELRREVSQAFASLSNVVPPSLLDVLDIYTFVERRAMDGYAASASIWTSQGSLMSILQSLCNEAMNELFFDLRPLSQGDGLAVGEYSRDPDEIQGNVDGGTSGVCYVPAVVMREYPFSTITSVDGRNAAIRLRGANGDFGNYGIIHFGAIFSNEPNIPGRHLVNGPNINIEDRILGRATERSEKHLDVAVLHEVEITKTALGRSDHEHFNLMEFYSDGVLGEDAKYFMQDLLPIITPVHVMRHGLRVRSLTTRFATLGRAASTNTTPVTSPPPEEAAPVAPTVSTSVVSPIQSGGRLGATSTAPGRYGYRARPRTAPTKWIFHNGIDIGAALGTPVYVVMDGEVVVSTPNGTDGFDFYGQTLIIKHAGRGDGGTDIYSFYAHMGSRLVAPQESREKRAAVSEDLMAGGRLQPVPVRAGQQIGTVGITAGRNYAASGALLPHVHDSRDSTFSSSESHLHFELLTPSAGQPIHPSQNLVATPQISFETPPGSGPKPVGVNPRSTDPVAFFSTKGVNLVAAVGGSGVEPEVADTDSADAEPAPAPEDINRPRPVTPAPTPPGAIAAAVDSVDIRHQIGRWALLQDHWYQHNLEYLSGTIEMRGAPEIRVGYRADIAERNLSFYVEGVNHSWTFPDRMFTTLTVTRGQANNPFPVYVLPKLPGFNATEEQRRVGSRLGKYFITPDPIAVRRALVLGRQASTDLNTVDNINFVDGNPGAFTEAIIESEIYANPTLDDLDATMGELDRNAALDELDATMGELDRNAALDGVTTEGAGLDVPRS